MAYDTGSEWVYRVHTERGPQKVVIQWGEASYCDPEVKFMWGWDIHRIAEHCAKKKWRLEFVRATLRY